MSARGTSILLAGILFEATVSLSAQPSKPNFAELETLVQAELKRNNLPGCAVAVVLGDETIFAKGFGKANIDTGEAVTADSLFRLGSTTKMFTAATLVSLAEAGKLKLDAPIGDYVKSLHPKLARLTSQQLLSHTAGLADETKMEGLHDESALAEALRVRKDDLCFTEPGKIWSYSNPGYWLAGLVIEEVSGEHYADEVRNRVLTPLGMKHSTFRPTEAMTWPLAVGHDPQGRGAASVIRPLADNAAGWPAGQLFTSAKEYARFCIAFMNGGKLDGHQALSSFMIEQLSTPHASVPGSERHYGYGLSIEDEEGLRWLSHSGNRSGYGSMVKMCPAKKFAVVILCNKTGESLPRVAAKASEIVLGIAPPKRNLRHEPLPTTTAELQRLAGVYSNGKTRIRLYLRDGKLVAPVGRELKKIGENRFLAARNDSEPDAEIVFVPGSDGQIQYLFRGGRALKKLGASSTE